jgi:DNA polymerase-3 subunit delta'
VIKEVIKQYLENHYNIGRLSNCYLINTDDIDNALSSLNEFISSKLLSSAELKIDNHPDYISVQKSDNKLKNISVDQIRLIQKFLYKTSVISGKKVAVIYAADQMNLNAANSCLKILEDTPTNAYIFLITSNAANIIPTIRSRCAKINHHYKLLSDIATDIKFLKPLNKKTNIAEKLGFIAEFAYKDRDLWMYFSVAMEKLIAKFCKKTAGISVDLSKEELSILAQFSSTSPYYVQMKYDKIKKIIDDTNIFDLDLRSSCLILIDKFRS